MATDDEGNHVHDENCGSDSPLAFIMDASQHRQRAVMIQEALGHQVKDFMEGLDEEQLRTLNLILDSCVTTPNPAQMAGYLMGRVASILERKFGICGACGTKHEDARELAPEVPVEVPEHVQARRNLDAAGDYTPIGSTLQLDEAEIAVMKIYNLDDLRDSDTMRLIAFVCLGCGQQYSTISDRMMKPPGVEGCSGCQQKAKFG